MTTCSRMIKVICKLSTSNAFQFGTFFFFQFAVVTGGDDDGSRSFLERRYRRTNDRAAFNFTIFPAMMIIF